MEGDGLASRIRWDGRSRLEMGKRFWCVWVCGRMVGGSKGPEGDSHRPTVYGVLCEGRGCFPLGSVTNSRVMSWVQGVNDMRVSSPYVLAASNPGTQA